MGDTSSSVPDIGILPDNDVAAQGKGNNRQKVDCCYSHVSVITNPYTSIKFCMEPISNIAHLGRLDQMLYEVNNVPVEHEHENLNGQHHQRVYNEALPLLVPDLLKKHHDLPRPIFHSGYRTSTTTVLRSESPDVIELPIIRSIPEVIDLTNDDDFIDLPNKNNCDSRITVLRSESPRAIDLSISSVPEVIDLTNDTLFIDLLNENDCDSTITETEQYVIKFGTQTEDEEKALEALTEIYAIPCGHDPAQFVDGRCQMLCGVKLLCEDICSGTCHSCSQGRIHNTCTAPCEKLLICGHVCNNPCRAYCPPCSRPCQKWCFHRKCQLICGIPCKPCKKPCAWKCDHLACTKQCFEECDRNLCVEHCMNKLSCGHFCVGVCGEICPPCKTCQPDLFPSLFYTSEEDHPAARYIKILPCEHNIEVTGFLRWLSVSSLNSDSVAGHEEVVPKTCPQCKTIITNNQHFKHIREIENNIMALKQNEFGNFQEITSLTEEVKAKINQVFKQTNVFLGTMRSGRNGQSMYRLIFKNTKLEVLKNYIEGHRLSKYALQVQSFLWDCLIGISSIITQLWKGYNDSTRKELKKRITYIVNKMVLYSPRFAEQQHFDFSNEVDRFCHLAQLKYLCLNPGYSLNSDNKYIKSALQKVNKQLHSSEPYTSKVAQENSNNIAIFKQQIKTAPHISVEDRQMIHKAFPEYFKGNRAQKHVYKCSEGHIYFVGDCGRPVEKSSCPVCNETIGGVEHQIVSSSSIAMEVFDCNKSRKRKLENIMQPETIGTLPNDLTTLLDPNRSAPRLKPSRLADINISADQHEKRMRLPINFYPVNISNGSTIDRAENHWPTTNMSDFFGNDWFSDWFSDITTNDTNGSANMITNLNRYERNSLKTCGSGNITTNIEHNVINNITTNVKNYRSAKRTNNLTSIDVNDMFHSTAINIQDNRLSPIVPNSFDLMVKNTEHSVIDFLTTNVENYKSGVKTENFTSNADNNGFYTMEIKDELIRPDPIVPNSFNPLVSNIELCGNNNTTYTWHRPPQPSTTRTTQSKEEYFDLLTGTSNVKKEEIVNRFLNSLTFS